MSQPPQQVISRKYNTQINTLLQNRRNDQQIPQASKRQILPSVENRTNRANTSQSKSLLLSLPHFSTKQCDVPSDFWCDSYELAQRCNVVVQCERIKRERRPLTVTLMYEALCPFCQRFITNNLGNLYSQFGNQIEVELVPWGNSILLKVIKFKNFKNKNLII